MNSITRASYMSDAERNERYARAIALYITSQKLSSFGVVFGFIGILVWPFLIVGIAFVVASFLALRRADKVNPYLKEPA